MKTQSPEFVEAFVTTCLEQGIGERATADMLHRTMLAEALEKDADFREGFAKVADTLTPTGTNYSHVIDPAFTGAGMQGIGGGILGLMGGGILAAGLSRIPGGKALLNQYPKMLGTPAARAAAGFVRKLPGGKLLTKAVPKTIPAGLVLGGGMSGAAIGANRGYQAGMMERNVLPGDNMQLPSWMMRGPTKAPATTNTITGSPYGWRPKTEGAATGGSTPINPQLPPELAAQQKKVQAMDKQIATLRGALRPGTTDELAVSNYRTQQELDRLLRQRRQEGAAYEGLMKNFQADKERTLSMLNQQYQEMGQFRQTQLDPANDMAHWLNKSDPNTTRGWLANLWGRFNQVPERAEWTVAARKTMDERMQEAKRVYDALNQLNPQPL